MKRKILWDPAAWAEVEEAFDYYAARSRRVAEVFRAELDDAVGRIAEDGEGYSLFDGDARRCLLGRYPFGVIYTLDAEYATVIVLMHTSRRPGYWKLL